jgi:hypothetical protein
LRNKFNLEVNEEFPKINFYLDRDLTLCLLTFINKFDQPLTGRLFAAIRLRRGFSCCDWPNKILHQF